MAAAITPSLTRLIFHCFLLSAVAALPPPGTADLSFFSITTNFSSLELFTSSINEIQRDNQLLPAPSLFQDFFTVFCMFPSEVSCNSTDIMEFYDDTTRIVLANGTCGTLVLDRPGTEFRFNWTDSRIYDVNLTCRHRSPSGAIQKSIKSIRLGPIACMNSSGFLQSHALVFAFSGQARSNTCRQIAPCDTEDVTKVCAYTKNGLDQCMRLTDESQCRSDKDSERYCPVNELGLCAATVRNHSATWFYVESYKRCPNGTISDRALGTVS